MTARITACDHPPYVFSKLYAISSATLAKVSFCSFSIVIPPLVLSKEKQFIKRLKAKKVNGKGSQLAEKL